MYLMLKEQSQEILSAATKNSEVYFGRSGESRSPSPTYTLPPAADALARAMAM
jgi:hypothetical protein